MKVRKLISMLTYIDYKIQRFNTNKLLNKIKNKELSKDQIDKLKTDVHNLEEDLMLIDCD